MSLARNWKRFAWHLLLPAAVLLMALAAMYAIQARQQRDQVSAEVDALGARMDAMRHQLGLAHSRVELVGKAKSLLSEVERAALRPASWGERRLGMRQQRIGRGELDDLLQSLVRSPDRLFGATAFDLSVTHADEGLFTHPGQSGNPVQVTIQGTQLFRTREVGL